jgi:hypothetical protein
MFFIARDPKGVADAAREAGGTVLRVAWSREGVRAW